MSRRHPSKRTLRRWAAGERPDLTHHVETCDRCLDDLEELTILDPRLRRALRAITDPESGFLARLEARLDARRRKSEAWSAAIELFSLGWRTFDALTERDEHGD